MLDDVGGSCGQEGGLAEPGRDATVWKAFAAEMLGKKRHPKVIQHAAIDMSAAYARGVSGNFEND